MWTDDATLRAYSHGNLAGYSTGVAESLVRHPVEAGRDEATEWCVLGVSRLHHLLARVTLTSKNKAGRHARTASAYKGARAAADAAGALPPRPPGNPAPSTWHPTTPPHLRLKYCSSVPRPSLRSCLPASWQGFAKPERAVVS